MKVIKKVFLKGMRFVRLIGQNIIYCLRRKTAIGRKKEQHSLCLCLTNGWIHAA